MNDLLEVSGQPLTKVQISVKRFATDSVGGKQRIGSCSKRRLTHTSLCAFGLFVTVDLRRQSCAAFE